MSILDYLDKEYVLVEVALILQEMTKTKKAVSIGEERLQCICPSC